MALGNERARGKLMCGGRNGSWDDTGGSGGVSSWVSMPDGRENPSFSNDDCREEIWVSAV